MTKTQSQSQAKILARKSLEQSKDDTTNRNQLIAYSAYNLVRYAFQLRKNNECFKDAMKASQILTRLLFYLKYKDTLS